MYILMALFVMIITYVFSFKHEYKKEDLDGVGPVLAATLVVVLLLSLGG
jgi:hypothetical protein